MDSYRSARTLVSTATDRAINQICGGGIRVARGTDPAEDPGTGSPIFLTAANPLVTEPEDEDACQKKGQIDRHEQGK